jgi:hypothetical protein
MENDEARMAGQSGAETEPGAEVESEQHADDFKRIRGIGRTVELRLHRAGVRSYAELAALPEAEIAGKAHVALQKVTDQDWRGQAAELTEQPSAVEPERSDTPSEDHQHYEVFTVEFLLDDDNEARRTRVVHVRSSQEASWPGWATKELLDFMTQHGAPPTRPETGVPAGTAVAHEPVRPLAATLARAPRPRVRKLETLPLGATKPQWLLPANQPFTIRVTLDLPGLEAAGEQPAEYVVSVAAKPVDGSPRQAIGEARGRLGALADLKVQSAGLRPGLYRLEGAVELGAASRDLPRFMPPMEDGVIDVS